MPNPYIGGTMLYLFGTGIEFVLFRLQLCLEKHLFDMEAVSELTTPDAFCGDITTVHNQTKYVIKLNYVI